MTKNEPMEHAGREQRKFNKSNKRVNLVGWFHINDINIKSKKMLLWKSHQRESCNLPLTLIESDSGKERNKSWLVINLVFYYYFLKLLEFVW